MSVAMLEVTYVLVMLQGENVASLDARDWSLQECPQFLSI